MKYLPTSNGYHALRSRISSLLLLILLGFNGCQTCEDPLTCGEGCQTCEEKLCETDPCAHPEKCSLACEREKKNAAPGEVGEDDVDLEGDFEPVPEENGGFGYEGNGTISFQLDCNSLAFEVEDANIQFNSDSLLKGLSGRIRMPESDDCFLMGPPNNPRDLVRADVFFHSGAYINETYELAFELEPEKEYFIMAMRADVNLGLCEPGGSQTIDALTFDINLGQLLYLIDPCDPMKYVDQRLLGVGSKAVGTSRQGNFPFVPEYPLEGKIDTFRGKSLKYGVASFKKWFEVEGLLIQSKTADVRLATDNFLESSFELGYQAGFNGAVSLDLAVLQLAIGQASGGIYAYAGTQGAGLRTYIHGIADPFGMWWPEFIPFKPINEREVSGYFDTQPLVLDLEMRTRIGIELPDGMSVVSGENSMETTLRFGTEEISYTRAYTLGSQTFDVKGAIRPHESELSAGLPPAFINNLRQEIIDRLDLKLEEIEAVEIDYTDAFEGYQLALGLDGLRKQIPAITAEARRRIDVGLKAGKKEASDRLPEIVKCNDCSDGSLESQIHDWIEDIGREYKAILNEMDAAVANTNDNAATRQQLEAALRKLISRRNLTGKRTFKDFCLKQNVLVGTICINNPAGGRTINLADYGIVVLNDSEVALLTLAADKVPAIPAAADRYLAVKEIYDRLKPEGDRIGKLRKGFEARTQPLPEIGRVGFVKVHATGKFSFFHEKGNGERVVMEKAFDPFKPETILDSFYGL